MESQFIITAVLSFLSGGAGVAIVNAIINRRKASAEAQKASAEATGILMTNRQQGESFWEGITSKREEFIQQLYDKVAELDKRVLDLISHSMEVKQENAGLRFENAKLTKRLENLNKQNARKEGP